MYRSSRRDFSSRAHCLPYFLTCPQCVRMFNSWKYSKGSYLVIIFAASFGTLILGIAFYLKNFSAILTGVIGGLTIILGMLTAEWLRSSRQQIEETRTSFKNLIINFERFLYSCAVTFRTCVTPFNKSWFARVGRGGDVTEEKNAQIKDGCMHA